MARVWHASADRQNFRTVLPPVRAGHPQHGQRQTRRAMDAGGLQRRPQGLHRRLELGQPEACGDERQGIRTGDGGDHMS